MAGIDRPTTRLPDFDLFNRDRNAGSGGRAPRFGETPRDEPQALPSGVASDSPDAAAAPEGALVFPPTPPGARAPGELSAAERYEMLQNLERVAGRLKAEFAPEAGTPEPRATSGALSEAKALLKLAASVGFEFSPAADARDLQAGLTELVSALGGDPDANVWAGVGGTLLAVAGLIPGVGEAATVAKNGERIGDSFGQAVGALFRGRLEPSPKSTMTIPAPGAEDLKKTQPMRAQRTGVGSDDYRTERVEPLKPSENDTQELSAEDLAAARRGPGDPAELDRTQPIPVQKRQPELPAALRDVEPEPDTELSWRAEDTKPMQMPNRQDDTQPIDIDPELRRELAEARVVEPEETPPPFENPGKWMDEDGAPPGTSDSLDETMPTGETPYDWGADAPASRSPEAPSAPEPRYSWEKTPELDIADEEIDALVEGIREIPDPDKQ